MRLSTSWPLGFITSVRIKVAIYVVFADSVAERADGSRCLALYGQCH